MDGVDHEWEYHQDGRDKAVEIGGRMAVAIGIFCLLWLLFHVAVIAMTFLYESAVTLVTGIVSMLVFAASMTC